MSDHLERMRFVSLNTASFNVARAIEDNITKALSEIAGIQDKDIDHDDIGIAGRIAKQVRDHIEERLKIHEIRKLST